MIVLAIVCVLAGIGAVLLGLALHTRNQDYDADDWSRL